MTNDNQHPNQHPGHASFVGRIGVSRSDITPPIGVYTRNWGAAKHDVAGSIHRPLTLSAMTLTNDMQESSLVLVEADLGWWQSQAVWQAFHARLLSEFSLEIPTLVFAVSHTHSGPPLTEVEPGMPGGNHLEAWLGQLMDIAIATIRTAQQQAFGGTLEWRAGRCRLASVRDLPDPDPESDRFICGYNPHAKADDTLLVGRVTDGTGRMRATLCNYACHPTTLAWENTAISPDYVGAMRETIEEVTGAPALFLQGASGELSPRHQYVADARVADRHGRQLGFAALATLSDMDPPNARLTFDRVVESGAPLAVWRYTTSNISRILQASFSSVDLPLKQWPTAEELDRQRVACTDRALQERLRRRRIIRQTVGDGETYRLPIWTWRIGETILVGSKIEAYSQLQRELRSRFPERTVVCGNLMNGSIGYLPPADSYDDDIYQVWQTPFDRGSLEKTIDAMARAIQDITSDERADQPAGSPPAAGSSEVESENS